MKKINLALVFGGKSGEHEVSLLSAKSIFLALDKNKYNIFLLGLDKNNNWFLFPQNNFLLNENNPKKISLNIKKGKRIFIVKNKNKINIINLNNNKVLGEIDVFFPIIHGSYGEDGSLQGFFEMIDSCYVGAGVLGSALGMDKDVQKRLLNYSGIKTAKFFVIKKYEYKKIDLKKILKKFKFPLFVKPACLGSSVGVSKVHNLEELCKAIEKAFVYDNKIMIEEYIKGREIECSVMGNDFPIASLPGEVIPHHDFYSYEAKYIDEKGADLIIPAKLSQKIIKKIQNIAIKVFQTLNCFGFSRIDFFLTENNEIYVNEINTLPGFTKISMFPKLFEISGIKYSQILDNLINLAFEKHKEKQSLKRVYD
ncbi:MAG: D-alanine--D-alanine ligase [Patescibacteria group bacterium]|nr:D-alanine--D-alanine ligase [Patescibacteria group bacterium]